MNKISLVFKYIAFFACLLWLYFFILVTSFHKYEWMLSEEVAEPMTWCDLPLHNDSLRGGMYVAFLFQFTLMGLVFFRRKNRFFNGQMFFVFCYATYAFPMREMLCVSFLR